MLLHREDEFAINRKKIAFTESFDMSEQENNSEIDELPESVDAFSDVSELYYETRQYLPLATSFVFDLSNRPAEAVDKYSAKRIAGGLLLGALLVAAGVAPRFFGQISETSFLEKNLIDASQAQPLSVSWLFVALGGLLILLRLIMIFSRREFLIGNSVVSIVIKKPFEKHARKSAPLSEYLGVRDRTRMLTWCGLISRTQHIIDLQHPDESKTIPLYVSFDGTGVNDRWVRYAKQLQKPALFYTADECINVPLEDIQTSHPDLIKKGIVEVNERNLYKIPSSMRISEKENGTLISPRMRDGALTLFAALLCLFSFFMIAGLTVILSSYLHLSGEASVALLIFALVMLVLVPGALFSRRRQVRVTKKGIAVRSKWFGVPFGSMLIKPDELEYVKVVKSSYDSKYSLVIGANGQTTHVGRGASKADLDWLCNFINAQIKRLM